MELQKYQHACFCITTSTTRILIDPGVFTRNLPTFDRLDAIIITHAHADHFDESLVDSLLQSHPDCIVFSASMADIPMTTQEITQATTLTVGDITLDFFPTPHAHIYDGVPTPANIGVRINENVYYGGDSLEVPPFSVNTVLLPVAAPWLRISDVLAYVGDLSPNRAIPTHDAIASDEGKGVLDRLVGSYCNEHGILYERTTHYQL